MERSISAASLDAWLDAERGRASALAEELGVTQTTVNYYRRGIMLPSVKGIIDRRAAIEKHTGGIVRASGWSMSTGGAS